LVKPPSDARIIENVPFYAQSKNQCGPASLASVLNYYGVAVTPDEIAAEIFSKSAKGTLNLDMLIYPGKKGLNAAQYSGSIEDIRTNINAGKPLIVLVDYGFSFYTQHHFMVVIGYTDSGFVVNSDVFQRQFVALEKFTAAWQKANNWTLLISKPD
jgi:ABC-type bacteriocin/lantibiotic exporter with double-glycine peptidase domain